MTHTRHIYSEYKRRPRAYAAGAPVPIELWCGWCGSRHIDAEDAALHVAHPCEICGWTNYPADYPTSGVWRSPTRYRKHLPSVLPISWCWYTRAPGLREIPYAGRTQGQNGAHPWPKARRLKRRQKRTGSKLRRRLWALTWRRELDMM